MMILLLLALVLALLAPVNGAPALTSRHNGHSDTKDATSSATPQQVQNALEAQKLNTQFFALSTNDSCKGSSRYLPLTYIF